MIQSMTGYGRSEYENDGREYTIDIKSINHKYCDINVRLPYSIGYLEEKIKKLIQNKIKRGKIDVNINFSNNSQIGKSININEELAGIYIAELRKLENKYEIRDDISVMQIAKLPDVLVVQNNKDEETIWNEISIALKEALDNFIKMRKYEGDRLKEDLQQRVKRVEQKIIEISGYSTRLISEYVVKLKKRMDELLQGEIIIDESRIAQEVVIYADKSSVEEEITRFQSHISQIKQILNCTDYLLTGKKLDFILQEMNREINTIGSKAIA